MKPYIFVQPEWKDFDRASGESKGWLSPPLPKMARKRSE